MTSTRQPLLLALLGLALAACGGSAGESADYRSDYRPTPSVDPQPTATEYPPAPTPTEDAPTPDPTAPPLVLSDADALEFAQQALEPYALTTFADNYGVDGCERIDDATSRCSTTIAYALNPSNPQACTLEIIVMAVDSKLGPKPWDPAESEEKTFTSSSGTHGDYQYGDTSQCEAAQQASGT
jgi:hypothetical protein